MNSDVFSQLDFGPLEEFLNDDDVTDISYSNSGQVHLKTLSRGNFRVDRPDINDALMDKLAFQCANVMGKSFNMAHPRLDAESAELRLAFLHNSIATNGIACTIRKTPAKIRLKRDKLLDQKYTMESVLDFLLTCVRGHCNIIVSGETGSGKTELVKYLASHIADNEKIITIEDTLELHLDKIFPHRDIVALKTNNIANYSDILEACMRQNPIWILLSEVRSAEAVMAVRNSISSGHHILSTIHSDKASLIPMRMFALIESNVDVEQFLTTIHRYVQIGVYVKGYLSKEYNRFQREILEVVEFYVDDNNKPKVNTIYKKNLTGGITMNNPTEHLRDYLGIAGIVLPEDIFAKDEKLALKEGRTLEVDGNVKSASDLLKIKDMEFIPDYDFTGPLQSSEEKKAESVSSTETVTPSVSGIQSTTQVNEAPVQSQVPITPNAASSVSTNISQPTQVKNITSNNVVAGSTTQSPVASQTSFVVQNFAPPQSSSVALQNMSQAINQNNIINPNVG